MAFESGVSLRKRKETKMSDDDNDSDSSEDSSVGSTNVSESVSR